MAFRSNQCFHVIVSSHNHTIDIDINIDITVQQHHDRHDHGSLQSANCGGDVKLTSPTQHATKKTFKHPVITIDTVNQVFSWALLNKNP